MMQARPLPPSRDSASRWDCSLSEEKYAASVRLKI